MLQTLDGGKSWRPEVASLFGQVRRIRQLPSGAGVVLFRYGAGFDWPSELYRVVPGQESVSAYRDKFRDVTDVLLFPDAIYLAAIERTGNVPGAQLPGKLRMLRTTDLKSWQDMKVDYRAGGNNAILARSPSGRMWVATDSGMILHAVP
jgi:hypothetical protein